MLNRVLLIGCLFLLISCGNEKILQLPEIENAEITKVLDVSPAYIFYDETKEDSVELNRKNLIISTNWLVNVDKRLTLEQALPSIIKLQDKKRNATMHKNKNARNYYTCNDTSIKNLGFIDFTEVVYKFDTNRSKQKNDSIQFIDLKVKSMDSVDLNVEISKDIYEKVNSNYKKLIYDIEALLAAHKKSLVTISLNKKLIFQDYIKLKSILIELLDYNESQITINNNEFIY